MLEAKDIRKGTDLYISPAHVGDSHITVSHYYLQGLVMSESIPCVEVDSSS